MNKNIKIGIIGVGNMGSAIAQRLKTEYKIYVCDKDRNKINETEDLEVISASIDLVKMAEVIILAVKPQDFENLLKEIKDYAKTKLVMSIAAGITTDYIEKCLTKARIIRIMPNLPLKVNKGMICICKGKTANEKDLTFAKQLFKSMGEVLILEEKMMDAATAISGSGPGYLYDFCENKNVKDIRKYAREFFIPQLIASARNIGFSSQEAEMLATFTAEGSIFFLEKAKLSPAEAKKQVASKGGTTEAALEILHKGGSLAEAVKAACRRAQELSRR